MKTVRETQTHIEERNSLMEERGSEIIEYRTPVIVDNVEVKFWIRRTEHFGDVFIEIVCNMFWSSPIEVFNGRISWSSGPSTIGNHTSKDVAVVMGVMFDAIEDYL